MKLLDVTPLMALREIGMIWKLPMRTSPYIFEHVVSTLSGVTLLCRI